MLDVSDDTHELVGTEHEAALDPDNETALLIGAVLILDNPRPTATPTTPSQTMFHIGGSTMHEAATEVIGAFDAHASEMPTWVASTNEDLAEVVAEHYTLDGYSTCTVISMDEAASLAPLTKE